MAKPFKMESSAFLEDSPQFFKIFTPENCSKKLRIPLNFVKNFKNTKPFKSRLRTSDERSWQVDVIKDKKYLFFENGWLEFVQYYSIKDGDFLLFYYNDNARFDVTIFGLNARPKPLPTCTDSIEVEENFQTSNYPSFEKVMKRCYVYTYLSIPINFWKKYIREDKDTAKLIHSNESWDVEFRNPNKITVGWPKFVAENHIKEGYICKFELISTTDYVFNVTIRKPDYKSRGKSKQI